MLAAQEREEALLELADLADRQLVEIAVHAGEDHHHLLLDRQRRELRLLEELGEAGAAVEEALGGGVEVRAELGEGGHLAVLGELALDRAGDLLHRLDLGGGADAADTEMPTFTAGRMPW